ncbi:hypothetical protein BD410DRAFT_801634 [Rickenella mellea]|uniref:Vacuolar membrane-associated protein IML1 n=1 Tax=Rickenella mellea TaxID=50990 RepID=A0A4Y7QC94_9AGAM|nr:hypothetical protein BD410DRAFT_801634 [Rickenella mellea]
MSNSRSESQNAPFSRKRSNTVQSLLRPRPPSPIQVGDSKTLTLWVDHNSSDVSFNPEWWPGVCEGDMVKVTYEDPEKPQNGAGFLFIVIPRSAVGEKPNLQISVTPSIADAFGWRNNTEVTLTKVEQATHCADYIEIVFQDQYLGRCDMWRLGKQLQGRCLYVDQELSFVGSAVGKVQNMYIAGKGVSAALITSTTKAIYRSLSAKVTIFIQVCRELWEFAGDGERYNEKIVHSFLPALFRRWRDSGTNHIITIVLISRVYYEESEIEYASGPLRQDDEGSWYKDFFKVITDLEVVQDWKATLVSLKDSFWAFKRDILLTHHYHRAVLVPSSAGAEPDPLDQVRLVGQISFAHDGPILEALNLALNPTETHYVDRSLNLTGACSIIITPGTGYYRVPKRLLRLTTTRMLDQGFGVDLVSLAKPPLHQSPIFSFIGVEPEIKSEKDSRNGGRALDPLWGGTDDLADVPISDKKTFWWEPFWMAVSVWDQQMDLPFREDRFVARAKMHQIQMLGLLAHEVLASIQVPFLPDSSDYLPTPTDGHPLDREELAKQNADNFDLERFALRKTPTLTAPPNRNTISPSVSTSLGHSSSLRSSHEKRASIIQSKAAAAGRIPPIVESPRMIYKELPPEEDYTATTMVKEGLSRTSSQSSMHSSVSLNDSLRTPEKNRRREPPSSAVVGSKFTPSWLFNPFRSGSSQPQTSPVSVGAVTSVSATAVSSSKTLTIPSSRGAAPASSPTPLSTSRPPRPVAIKGTPSRRSTLSQRSEDGPDSSGRSSYTKYSPSNASPREDSTFVGRHATLTNLALQHAAAASPSNAYPRTNPLRPGASIQYTQHSLASRWQHMFPQPVLKHQIKWKSMVTPGCLPLTTEHFPTRVELDTSYDVFSYDFVVDPPEMRSFFVKSPVTGRESPDQARQAWALVVMREMAAIRLAQGFQFVVRPRKSHVKTEDREPRASKFYPLDDDRSPKPAGASEIFQSTIEPVYLSMNNEIHCISYSGEAIQVRRYVRRMVQAQPFEYQCLVWPKLGQGYTELKTSFVSQGLENYGWNRVDMLVAGYEHQINESLRYWRTRFVVIPTIEPPPTMTGPSGEKLNDEEVRLLGTDRLAELFTKVRWAPPGDKASLYPPIRFLPTYLGPAASVMDEHIVSQLDEIQATGPMGKKVKSERDIGEMSLSSIAKAMRDDTSFPIKDHKWHKAIYQDSFTGYEFVSWLVREFRDVSTREQGTEWGSKLQEQGLIQHCRGLHGFLDGHYFYQLKGEYAVARTPSKGGLWFRTNRNVSGEGATSGHYPSSGHKQPLRRTKKRLVLSQTLVVDVDPPKKSDQAENVILHYDIIHNPATVFHFELNWIGTTARCIEDVVRLWSRTIERYGLKLVEAYVTQISDIRDRNPFQSCFPLRPVIPAPIVPDLEKRVPEGTQTAHYFEHALLRKFNFILDIEAGELYSDRVDVFYSYRRSSFAHSQFVHRTGVAFVQVLGGSQGFLFLTNRLMAPGRMGESRRGRPAEAAEELRKQMQAFCADRGALIRFYDEQLGLLPKEPPEPPELSI